MLSDQEIEKITRSTETYQRHWGAYAECFDTKYVSYIAALLADRAELKAELERVREYAMYLNETDYTTPIYIFLI